VNPDGGGGLTTDNADGHRFLNRVVVCIDCLHPDGGGELTTDNTDGHRFLNTFVLQINLCESVVSVVKTHHTPPASNKLSTTNK
jgi:hypothetical protein